MTAERNYNLHPVVQVMESDEACFEGWAAVLERLATSVAHKKPCAVAVECYPGVGVAPILDRLRAAFPHVAVLNAETAYKSAAQVLAMLAETLTPDPVFGKMRPWRIEDFFDAGRLAQLRKQAMANDRACFVAGTGAAFVLEAPTVIVHAGATRWELQRRQRMGAIANLGMENAGDAPSRLYKHAFFVDWRVGDAVRHELFSRTDFFLDLEDESAPRMVSGDTLRYAIGACVRRPFRVEPFFDPGPWGGQWMKQKFGLPKEAPNYAWCFDCVPEENSLVLGFGPRRFRLPASVVVQEQPQALLGDRVYRRFGAEFPIRFDLLDTIEGGNLSLQVHPLTGYIRERFGMDYTQDESYYILDCAEGAELFLGLQTGVDQQRMRADLEVAQRAGTGFTAERYVDVWPTRRHDHYAIPAGTVHCSGAGNVVLEISATPYIFTFKLWDWGRLGLDGKPRPIHLEHGLANIQWDRDTAWVERELRNQVTAVEQGDKWREERTGLHELEFIETRRTWFTGPVTHDTEGNLHVLNLVEGDAAVVESPNGEFAPFEVHYAETFIVPAAVGRYRVRPLRDVASPLATIKAYVRADSSDRA